MKRAELKILPGFNPSPDSTELDGVMFQDGRHVRFYNQRFQTTGGTTEVSISNGVTLSGCNRFLINFRKDDNNIYTVIGGDTHLYALLGNALTNITPFQTSSYSLSNTMATNMATLGTNPFTTTINSGVVITNWTGHKLIAGDWVSMTGAIACNGIASGTINAEHYIQSTGANTFTFSVASTATSSGSTGGTTAQVMTDLVTVIHNTHGYSTGDRLNISGAISFGGIASTNVNGDKVIRVNTSNTYTFTCNRDYCSSSVSATGGTNAVEFAPIATGRCSASLGYGYGMGLYGVGNYGVAKTGYYPNLPRIWTGDFFGSYLILCPGTTGNSVGAPIYQWTGSTATAPSLIAAAPTDATYVFVDNNIIVALCNNVVKWSDIGDQTDWTAAATSYAGTRTFYGAGRLISRAEANGENLLFTSAEVYRFRFIDKPYVWDSQKLAVADGISGIHAAASFNGAIYWMGRKDIYRYNGSVVEAITPTTLREYIYQDIDTSQFYKVHCEVNAKYGEITWYYQSLSSTTDCDKMVKLSLHDSCWFYDTWDRMASEKNHILQYPRVINASNQILATESSYNDDDGSTLAWSIETNYAQIGNGDDTFHIQGLMFDAIQEGTAALTVYTKLSPQDANERTFGPYTISKNAATDVTKVDFRAHGRMRKYVINGTGFFRMGRCYELLEKGDGR